jgi:hypothetical protein
MRVLNPEPKNAIKTKHDLSFEAAPWEMAAFLPGQEFTRFRIGTIEGLFGSTETTFDILAVENSSPGNGHLDDVFQWFEYACKRDRKNLRVLECMNRRFKNHLITKRGFKPHGIDNLIKKIR